MIKYEYNSNVEKFDVEEKKEYASRVTRIFKFFVFSIPNPQSNAFYLSQSITLSIFKVLISFPVNYERSQFQTGNVTANFL